MFGVRHVKLDPRDVRTVYASAWNNAIHRSAPALENGDAAFKPVYAIVGFKRFQDLAMFDLTVQNGRTRMYVYNGTASVDDQALYRLDNADVPASTLVTGSGASLSNTGAWIRLTSNSVSNPGSTSRRLCSSQCFYDLVVAVPEGQPDTVILGGVATVDLGEPTIRSTNAGAEFLRIRERRAEPQEHEPRRRARRSCSIRGTRASRSSGSDGGVVRNDGAFVNIAGRCQAIFGANPPTQCGLALSDVPRRLYFMNKGLQTLQFYNVAVDPRAPLTRLIGGLQDNSTIWTDGTGDPACLEGVVPVWRRHVGVRLPSRAERGAVRELPEQPLLHQLPQRPVARAGCAPTNRSSLPSERATVTASTGRQFITFDLREPQHAVHRVPARLADAEQRRRSGVPRSELPVSGRRSCQRHVRGLGAARRGVSVSARLDAGFPEPPAGRSDRALLYGGDRAGGIIVAAERTPADAGTLWAATNFGRLFVSKNADGPAAAVEFVRIDPPSLPNRFVTRVLADRANPNVAYISYSGFNAMTPSTPGHVFRAVYNPVAAPGDVHVARLRPRRYPDQHHRVRRPARAISTPRPTSGR